MNKSPDAKDKFAEINSAYETLGDEQKRSIYDQTGMTGDEQQQAGGGFPGGFEGGFPGGFPGGFSGGFPGGFPGGGQEGAPGGGFRDIFEDFESFFNMGQGKKGDPRAAASVKGKDVTLNIEIEFMEAVNGAQKTVAYNKIDNWSRWNGTGAQPGTGETNCPTCSGTGFQAMRQGSLLFQTTCHAWGGAGRVIRNPWLSCQGQGSVQSRATETVNIPKGVDNGVNLRMNGKGNSSKSGPAGDLMIKISVKEHPYFKRNGFDINTDKYITVSQAILGGEAVINTLSGDVKVTINPGTQHNDKKRLTNCGINKLPPNHRQKGDHYVNFKVEIPKSLSAKQKEAILKYAEVEDKIVSE